MSRIAEVTDLKTFQKNKVLNEFLLRTGKIPRPPCWKCKGKVPRMAVDVDTEKDCITITAFCHGEKETLYIPTQKTRYITKIEIGWAFVPSSGRKLEKSEC